MRLEIDLNNKEEALNLMSNLAKNFQIENKEYMTRGFTEKKNNCMQKVLILNDKDIIDGIYSRYKNIISVPSQLKSSGSLSYGNSGSFDSDIFLINQKNSNAASYLTTFDYNIKVVAHVFYDAQRQSTVTNTVNSNGKIADKQTMRGYIGNAVASIYQGTSTTNLYGISNKFLPAMSITESE